MARRLVALLPLAMLAGALVPGVGLAAPTANPLNPVLPTISTPTVTSPAATVPVTTTAAPGGGSFSGADAIAVAAGAFALLAGISFFIWRDARRRAPQRGRAVTATADAGGRAANKPRPKTRKPSPAERRRRKRGRAR